MNCWRGLFQEGQGRATVKAVMTPDESRRSAPWKSLRGDAGRAEAVAVAGGWGTGTARLLAYAGKDFFKGGSSAAHSFDGTMKNAYNDSKVAASGSGSNLGASATAGRLSAMENKSIRAKNLRGVGGPSRSTGGQSAFAQLAQGWVNTTAASAPACTADNNCSTESAASSLSNVYDGFGGNLGALGGGGVSAGGVAELGAGAGGAGMAPAAAAGLRRRFRRGRRPGRRAGLRRRGRGRQRPGPGRRGHRGPEALRRGPRQIRENDQHPFAGDQPSRRGAPAPRLPHHPLLLGRGDGLQQCLQRLLVRGVLGAVLLPVQRVAVQVSGHLQLPEQLFVPAGAGVWRKLRAGGLQPLR